MIIWVDAQLSPALASWIQQQFSVEAASAQALGLRDSNDQVIFGAAKAADARVVWIRYGNTSNQHLKELLVRMLPRALELFESGERLVEIAELL